MSGSTRGPRSTLPVLQRVVLAVFTDPTPLTRAQLADLTGLSRPVLNAVVDALVAVGELTELPAGPRPAGQRGRPPRRYIRPALVAPVLLIELDKDTHTTLTLLSADGKAVDRRRGAPWSADWDTWSSVVRRQAADIGAGAAPRITVVAAPFPVRDEQGMPAVHPLPEGMAAPKPLPSHPQWLLDDPRPPIAQLLDMPTIMINDANLAALGEAHFGAGAGYRGMLHVSVRYGIGAGLVFDGALITGANGFAGELAHVQVREQGDYCVCGNRGCLATETLGPDLVDAISAVFGRPLRMLEVQQLAAHDQPLVIRYLRDLGVLIGRAVSSLITAVDPDAIIVDARLENAAAPVIDGLSGELARRCPADLLARLQISPGLLLNAHHCGAIAAANSTIAVNRASPFPVLSRRSA